MPDRIDPFLPLAAVVAPDDAPPPRRLDVAVLVALVLMLATVAYALRCGTPLIWDGSYQLGEMLIAGEPYAYLTRFHTLIVWRPVVWAMRWTDDVPTLQAIYGAPFLLAPVVGLAASWWFVRRRQPGLVVWAAVGILATALPGQIFVINDSVFQQHLFWPVFVGLLVPLTRPQRVAWYGLVVFQFAHQIGLVLLAGGCGAALLVALFARDRADRRRLLLAAALAALLAAAMAGKVWLTSRPTSPYYDSFAAAEATWQVAQQRWWRSVTGLPFRGLKLVYLAAALLALHGWLAGGGKQAVGAGRARRRLAAGAAGLTVLAIVGVALVWGYWSGDPRRWEGAIDYRRWVVPLTVPAFLLATVEVAVRARRKGPSGSSPVADTTNPNLLHRPAREGGVVTGTGRSESTGPHPSGWGNAGGRNAALSGVGPLALRSVVVVLLAGLFALVLARQSRGYKALADRLAANLAASPATLVRVGPDHGWLNGTPLDHWPITWLALELQGKRPTKWFVSPELKPGQLDLVRDPRRPLVAVSQWSVIPPTPGPGGWFDLRDLAARAAEELKAAESKSPTDVR
ncbi:MAG: hypothetical protein JWO31_565 [Phycisphaerales bacterium]|nr:hypothetical protein [Phycisphaerales bacterium]